MATSKKSTKSTSKSGSTEKSENTQTQNAEVASDVEVSGAWTVVEETVVNSETKEGDVVHIKNVDVNEEEVSPRTGLYRDANDKILGGVCAGLAKRFGLEPVLVRILWVGATVLTLGGSGLAAYLAFWLLLPSGTAEEGVVAPAPISFNGRSNGLPYAFIAAGALILLARIGILGGLVGGIWSVLSVAFWPAVMIGMGYMLLDRSSKSEWKQSVREAKASAQTRFKSKVEFTNKVDGESIRSGFSKARSSVPMRRSSSDSMMMGVCGGLAQKVGIDANLIRFGWVILTLFSGVVPGIVAYFVLGLLMPQDGTFNTTVSEKAQARQTHQKIQDVQIL